MGNILGLQASFVAKRHQLKYQVPRLVPEMHKFGRDQNMPSAFVPDAMIYLRGIVVAIAVVDPNAICIRAVAVDGVTALPDVGSAILVK